MMMMTVMVVVVELTACYPDERKQMTSRHSKARVGTFLPEGEKDRFFHGKNRTGKNTFCRQK